MYTHNQAHCKPITIYGFHCTQGALQMASNILSPNYTTQWNTLNEVSVYTQHSAVPLLYTQHTKAINDDKLATFWGAEGAPILFSEIGFCVASCSYNLYIYIYIYMYISVKMAAPWGSLTLLSFHSLCLHLCSHLTKWEVFHNTSS